LDNQQPPSTLKGTWYDRLFTLSEEAKRRLQWAFWIGLVISTGLAIFIGYRDGMRYALLYWMFALSFLGVPAATVLPASWAPVLSAIGLVVTTVSFILSPPWAG